MTDCPLFYRKDYDELVVLGLHWDKIAEPGDTLLSAQWLHSTAFEKAAESVDGLDTSIALRKGGPVGRQYPITCIASFNQAGVRKATITVEMVEKGLML